VAGSSNHGAWLGTYNKTFQRWLQAEARPGSVVYDLGAHVGFLTLLASRLVGPAGRVFAFEPNPRNLSYLRRHLELNRIENVHIRASAVSDQQGTAKLDDRRGHLGGRLNGSGRIEVETVALDDLELPPPDCVKLNIEGAELRALKGAARIIDDAQPTLLLATHGHEVRDGCLEFLDGLGYKTASFAPTPSAAPDHHNLLLIPERRPVG
jgi:FkbM family methyltransferase